MNRNDLKTRNYGCRTKRACFSARVQYFGLKILESIATIE